jgi:hypothetical protein
MAQAWRYIAGPSLCLQVPGESKRLSAVLEGEDAKAVVLQLVNPAVAGRQPSPAGALLARVGWQGDDETGR